MQIMIRKAVAQDAEVLCHLNEAALGYDYDLEHTKQNVVQLLKSEQDGIWIAFADDSAAGYIHVREYQCIYAPKMVDIMGIAVLYQYRACGIGSKLLSQAEAWAKKRKAAGMRLVSGAQRTGAHAFYEHCGYTDKKLQYNLKKLFDE